MSQNLDGSTRVPVAFQPTVCQSHDTSFPVSILLPPVIQRFALTHEYHVTDLPFRILQQGKVA